MRIDAKRLSKRLAAVFMAGVLAVGMIGVTAFADEKKPDPIDSITITKHVTTDGKTYAPNTSFKFTVATADGGTYKGEVVKAGVTGGLYFASGKDSIKYDPGDPESGFFNKLSDYYIEETELSVNADKFTETGIYHYTLTETKGTYEGITYDTKPRDVYVYVYQDDTTKDYYVGGVIVVNGSEKSGVFTNDYGYTKDTTHDLTITKKVTGTMGDHNKEFVFNVKVTGATGEKYYVVVKSDSTVDGTAYTMTSGTAAAYKIKDTGSIQIYGLTESDNVNVTETDPGDGYIVTSSTTGTELTANGKTVSGNVVADATKATVTNDKGSTPTGLVFNYGPYVLMIALAGAMAFFFLRRRNEEY